MICKKVLKNIPLYISQDLKEEEVKEINSHIKECPKCRKEYLLYRDDMENMRSFKDATFPEGLLNGFYGEIRRRLKPEKEKIVWLHRYARAFRIATVAAAIIICVIIFLPMESHRITEEGKTKGYVVKNDSLKPPKEVITTFYYEESVCPVDDGVGF